MAEETRIADPNYIQVMDVTKRFGAYTAIDGVSLDIERGEFFSLLGPSGCGKSTLLRMIAGFEEPTEGKILLDGDDVTSIPAHKRPTNMMFQSYALFPHLTVEKNIAFGLVQDRLPKAEITARVKEAVGKLHLGDFTKRKPSQLSGGQRQRVALARALVKQPKVLLLDEPLGALDRNLRVQTQLELMRLQKELGLTFVIVTHDQEEAMTVSSRIAIMDQGEIVQIGTPERIYEEPISRYVAQFLGETNLFGGIAGDRQGDETSIDSDEAGAPILAQAFDDIKPGDQVWVSVRPERVRLSKDGAGLSGTIEEASYVGSEWRYVLRLANGATLQATRANEGDSGTQFLAGDAVTASWKPASARLLTE